MVKPFLSETTCFYNFFTTIKVNLVAKIMQSAYLCVIFHVKQKKSPFLVVLPWFPSLGEIQDGDHCWWRHRPPAVPPLIKYSLSHREDQRLSTEGKIVSEYSNIPKPLGGFHLLPPPFTTLVGLCRRAPPMDNFNVFISRTIVRWWDTTRPAPGLTWSTGALFSALFRLGALKWNYITLWIRNRVDAKSFFFLFFPVT